MFGGNFGGLGYNDLYFFGLGLDDFIRGSFVGLGGLRRLGGCGGFVGGGMYFMFDDLLF